MALLNVALSVDNLVPVNGQYVFTTQFIDSGGNLIVDNKYPQNQVFNKTSGVSPIELDVEIGDGNYTVPNGTKLRILYKTQVIDKDISGAIINCLDDCTAFPVVSVTAISSTTYSITLGSIANSSYTWKIFNSSSVQVASGTANVTASNFNITTPALSNGNYIFELVGTTCKGKSTKSFVVNNTLPLCGRGPILMSIISSNDTSLKFQFDGEGVFGISWKIKQGTSVVREGVVKHTSIAQPGDQTFTNSTPTVTFPSLAAGTYNFEISGFTCTTNGTSPALPFTISGGGGGDPLAFVSGSPSATGSSGNYSMSIAINKSGAYNTVILNTTTGTYYQQGNITYTSNVPYIKTGLPVGTYSVTVGTLQTSLVIQDSGSGACTSGPTLVNVNAASQTGLTFLFDANNVTAITWRIKQGTTTLRNGVVYPTNNTPFITYSELPYGDYTLEIEGNNCSSPISTKPFSIIEAPQGNNAGVIVTNVGNKYIGIINARYFKAVANPSTGNIRLFYDEISTADGSSTQVKGWLMGSQMSEIKQASVTELRSNNGKSLPDGVYDFYLYYFPTSVVQSFDQIKPNLGLVVSSNWAQNSKIAERVVVEIKTNASL